MIYNHQLCLIDRRVWPFAVKSISDWKNEYHPECAQLQRQGRMRRLLLLGEVSDERSRPSDQRREHQYGRPRYRLAHLDLSACSLRVRDPATRRSVRS